MNSRGNVKKKRSSRSGMYFNTVIKIFLVSLEVRDTVGCKAVMTRSPFKSFCGIGF